MMKRRFLYMFEVDEFIDKLVDNGHYGDILVVKDGDMYIVKW